MYIKIENIGIKCPFTC